MVLIILITVAGLIGILAILLLLFWIAGSFHIDESKREGQFDNSNRRDM